MGYPPVNDITILLCIGLFCVVPFLIGLVMLANSWRSPLGRFAALLTLKPLVATPLLFAVILPLVEESPLRTLLTLVPGITLTLLIIAVAGTPLFTRETRRVSVLLLFFDALRYLSTFALFASLDLPVAGPDSWTMSLICLPPFMPLVFAVAAAVIIANHPPDTFPTQEKYKPLNLGDLSTPLFAAGGDTLIDLPEYPTKRKNDELYPPDDEKPKRESGDVLIDLPPYTPKPKNNESEG